MSSLSGLGARATRLAPPDLARLGALVGDWQLLADLSFADLVLHARARDDDGWVVLAQVRPSTGPTCLLDDVVGSTLAAGERPLLDRAWESGRILRDGDPLWWGDVPVREEAIPLLRDGSPVAVVSRVTNLSAARSPSRLELTYLRSATDLAQMVSEGRFPYPDQVPRSGLPRVGDGLVRLDAAGRVEYASPNALSAYRRLGLAVDLEGQHLGRLTDSLVPAEDPVDESLASALDGRAPRVVEAASGDVVVMFRVLPLQPAGRLAGALVLLRDVTELRTRDRQLVTKDATIREIHHRVKNNLQTVAALLRIQARRVAEPGARHALEEAVRRVGSIAVVHESLSLSLDERVDFDGICDRVLQLATELAPVEDLDVRREGGFGELPARVATPLAMALAELVQNAVEHGVAPRGRGRVVVEARRHGGALVVTVRDDGVGLPDGADGAGSDRLGLGIVRALVVTELGGGLALGPGPGGGTEARIAVRLDGVAPVAPGQQ